MSHYPPVLNSDTEKVLYFLHIPEIKSQENIYKSALAQVY